MSLAGHSPLCLVIMLSPIKLPPQMAQFISIAEFKQFTGVNSFKRVLNPTTGKYSLLLDNGKFVKVQQDLDTTKDMVFIIGDDEEIIDGCLINCTSKFEDTGDVF
jgi:hypothetical protein